MNPKSNHSPTVVIRFSNIHHQVQTTSYHPAFEVRSVSTIVCNGLLCHIPMRHWCVVFVAGLAGLLFVEAHRVHEPHSEKASVVSLQSDGHLLLRDFVRRSTRRGRTRRASEAAGVLGGARVRKRSRDGYHKGAEKGTPPVPTAQGAFVSLLRGIQVPSETAQPPVDPPDTVVMQLPKSRVATKENTTKGSQVPKTKAPVDTTVMQLPKSTVASTKGGEMATASKVGIAVVVFVVLVLGVMAWWCCFTRRNLSNRVLRRGVSRLGSQYEGEARADGRRKPSSKDQESSSSKGKEDSKSKA